MLPEQYPTRMSNSPKGKRPVRSLRLSLGSLVPVAAPTSTSPHSPTTTPTLKTSHGERKQSPHERSGGSTSSGDPPRCFKCGNDSAVTKMAFWAAQGVWIWHCSAEPMSGNGSTFCGHLFVEERREMKCLSCSTPMLIERHQRCYCYWCPACKTYGV